MKRVFFIFVALCLSSIFGVSAQNIASVRNSLSVKSSTGGVISITEDEGVKSAVARIEQNGVLPAKADGYRFVIYYDNQQFADERASRVMSRFRAKYKDVTSYVDPEPPTFRVVVGDCFNYEDVAIIFNRISDDYPDAALTDAKIPYRKICNVRGANHMMIERCGDVSGGVEVDDSIFEELDGDDFVVVSDDAADAASEATQTTAAEM